MSKLDNPLNTEERYLHGINVRLNILIEMMSSFLDVYAKEEEIATTENKEEIENVQEESKEDKVKFDYSKLTKAEIIKDLEIHGVYNTKSMLKDELVGLANEYL